MSNLSTPLDTPRSITALILVDVRRYGLWLLAYAAIAISLTCGGPDAAHAACAACVTDAECAALCGGDGSPY